MKEALTFDDVQLIPRLSSIMSRNDVNTGVQFTRNYWLDIPLIAAPMDTVCEFEMARSMWELGGAGVIHRFMSIENQSEIIGKLYQYIIDHKRPNGSHRRDTAPVICAAIGANGDSIVRARELINSGANVLVIDVAHGHHLNVEAAIKNLINLRNETGIKFDIIAGNIATSDAASDLMMWGADALRVGIGGGSVCETRIRTGVGVPQLTAILDTSGLGIPIISDGGIRYPGDIAKAIAAGADTVMMGSMFAGTDESPGEVFISGSFPKIKKFKVYRGSASASIKMEKQGNTNYVEGASTLIESKGSVKNVVSDIMDGLKSSMSYLGISDVKFMRSAAEFVKITNAGLMEAHPHLLLK